MREQLAELLVELGGQGLVVRDHQRREPQAGEHVGHRKSLAGTGDAEKALVLGRALEALDQALDRLGLIALGRHGGHQLKTPADGTAMMSGGNVHKDASFGVAEPPLHATARVTTVSPSGRRRNSQPDACNYRRARTPPQPPGGLGSERSEAFG